MKREELWLYCEKCESSYVATYWCACWDSDDYYQPLESYEP
jgi:hypothetical protein